MDKRKYYSSARPEVFALFPTLVDRHLDVGCAAGRFGESLLREGLAKEVWGVEPTLGPCTEASQRLSKVIHGYFDENTPLPDEYFDSITFNDSLEHMPDEITALKVAWKKLKPNGNLIVSLPNIRYIENIKELLIEKDWRYVDAGVLDRTHLRFFTKLSMQRTIIQCGFKIERIEGINSHWWSGWKIYLLRFLFQQHIEDMRWKQFVVVAKKIQ
ncbi:class I SAM-dependent methyltransferase [Roseateles koreensis]|uniref:Class I SAM-dependent methyltransferase n=1 Tax=Roseateles koreensis TaxID=2987526 RepID=A0ABT5KTI7_9BURK|nr:class I SAM-dependent methyltransferase [Roseateles koreensis]MDC8786162.1 class I SAM-dependent methyltransferase [Roseateles koreensis]